MAAEFAAVHHSLNENSNVVNEALRAASADCPKSAELPSPIGIHEMHGHMARQSSNHSRHQTHPHSQDNAGEHWHEPHDSPTTILTSRVPRLPPPHRTTSTSLTAGLYVERPCLRGIREMLLAQRDLQNEFEVRWTSMVKRDEELLRGIDVIFEPRSYNEESWSQPPPLAVVVDATAGEEREVVQEAEPKKVAANLLNGLKKAPSPKNGAKATTSAEADVAELVESEETRDKFSQATSRRKSQMFDLAEELQREDDQQDSKPTPMWVSFARSDRFDLGIGFVIVINTLTMLISLEVQGWQIKESLYGACRETACDEPEAHPFFIAAEHCFTVVFVLEMFLRLAADGLQFLLNIMHLLDVFIVLISVIDLWILVPLGNGGGSGMAVLRIARLAKLAKVFRVVRVLKAFEPLRILVITISHSVGALAWSMTLLFVFELIGAIFLSQLLQPFALDDSNELELRKVVWERFGTWSRAMFSAYEITMAPGGFLQYRAIIERVNPLVGVFFVLYGCTVTFAVIRVITALFLRATLSVCEKEEFEQGAALLLQRNAFAERLRSTIDSDGSGGIDYTEFTSLIDIPQMSSWLADSGLSNDSAKRLFRSLMNESGEMNLSQFLHLLSQMKGQPRAADMIVVSYETRKVLDHTTLLMQSLEENLGIDCRSSESSGSRGS